MIRVAIDPNIVSRLDPSLTVAELSDADGPVSEGDKVTVVQEGDPDKEYQKEFDDSIIKAFGLSPEEARLVLGPREDETEEKTDGS